MPLVGDYRGRMPGPAWGHGVGVGHLQPEQWRRAWWARRWQCRLPSERQLVGEFRQVDSGARRRSAQYISTKLSIRLPLRRVLDVPGALLVVRGDLSDRTLDTLTGTERRVKRQRVCGVGGHDAAGPDPLGRCGRGPLVWPRSLSPLGDRQQYPPARGSDGGRPACSSVRNSTGMIANRTDRDHVPASGIDAVA